MARNDPTIYLRIPQELKDRLDAASASDKRSLTAEVVARLESSFTSKDASDLEAMAQMFLMTIQSRGELLVFKRKAVEFRLKKLEEKMKQTHASALDVKNLSNQELDELEGALGKSALEADFDELLEELNLIIQEQKANLEAIRAIRPLLHKGDATEECLMGSSQKKD